MMILCLCALRVMLSSCDTTVVDLRFLAGSTIIVAFYVKGMMAGEGGLRAVARPLPLYYDALNGFCIAARCCCRRPGR